MPGKGHIWTHGHWEGKEAVTGHPVEASPSPALSLPTHTCPCLNLPFLPLPELCLLPSLCVSSAVSGAGDGWRSRAQDPCFCAGLCHLGIKSSPGSSPSSLCLSLPSIMLSSGWLFRPFSFSWEPDSIILTFKIPLPTSVPGT